MVCEKTILHVNGSLLDLPLLSSGYDISEYLESTRQNLNSPWIVTNFPPTDYIEHNNFLPTINADYSTFDTSSNHLGNDNHVKNQFGNTFIPSNIDTTLNSLLNSDTIRAQPTPVVQIPNHYGEKCTDHIHNVDAVSTHKPFGGFKKQPITAGNAHNVCMLLNNLYVCLPGWCFQCGLGGGGRLLLLLLHFCLFFKFICDIIVQLFQFNGRSFEMLLHIHYFYQFRMLTFIQCMFQLWNRQSFRKLSGRFGKNYPTTVRIRLCCLIIDLTTPLLGIKRLHLLLTFPR